jgi:hypothetical protein
MIVKLCHLFSKNPQIKMKIVDKNIGIYFFVFVNLYSKQMSNKMNKKKSVALEEILLCLPCGENIQPKEMRTMGYKESLARKCLQELTKKGYFIKEPNFQGFTRASLMKE